MGCFVSKEREYHDENKERQFMQCIIRVDQTKKGWEKSVGKLLRSIEVRQGNVSKGDELIELSGFAVPRVMMRTLGKQNNRLKVEWIQYGKCSTLLFGPDRKKFQKPPPAPPVEESTSSAAIESTSSAAVAGEIGYPFRNCYPVYYPGNYGGYRRIISYDG